MQKVNAPPGAKRLIDGLRDLGYDFHTAVADLLDNSLAADATEVRIDIRTKQGSVPAQVVILDNGTGIPKDKLVDALRFGTPSEHSFEDLGKYGLGLKTASLSQARVLTVVSRARAVARRNQLHIARWDLDKLDDKWDLQLLDWDDLKQWEREAVDEVRTSDQGTAILWSALDADGHALDSANEQKAETALADLTRRLKDYLPMVFHRFLQGQVPRRRKVELVVCGETLKPWDPFCRLTERTKELAVQQFEVPLPDDSGKVASIDLSPFVLPTEEEFSSKEAHRQAGLGNWNQRQGFYFYRNNRLLRAGGWSSLRAIDEHDKYLRIAVDFPGTLDREFNINVSKMRAQIPRAVREAVRNSVTGWVKAAKARYDPKTRGGDGTAGPKRKVGKTRDMRPRSLAFGAVTVRASVGGVEPDLSVDGRGHVTLTMPESDDIFENRSPSLSAFARVLMELLAGLAEERLEPRQLPMKSLRRRLKEFE